MADAESRELINSLINSRLRSHLKLRKDSKGKHAAPPHSVLDFCKDLEQVTQARLWFMATCACALLAELLYGSETGGTFLASDEDRRQKRKRAAETGAHTLRNSLRSLRNACFHPAHVTSDAGSGSPHIDNLADALRRWGEPQAADLLEKHYPFLRTSDVYVAALRMLDEVGKHLLTVKGPPPPSPPRPV
jgi:hypothetical protein